MSSKLNVWRTADTQRGILDITHQPPSKSDYLEAKVSRLY